MYIYVFYDEKGFWGSGLDYIDLADGKHVDWNFRNAKLRSKPTSILQPNCCGVMIPLLPVSVYAKIMEFPLCMI